MDFIDRLWVPHSPATDESHVIILIAIDISLFLFVLTTYFLVKYQINKSLKGFSTDSEIMVDSIVEQSLRTLYTGLSLLLISNIMSRLIIFFPLECPHPNYEQCYILIGEENYFLVIGMLLTMLGLFNFHQEIARTFEGSSITFKPYKFVLFSFIVLFSIQFVNVPSFLTIDTVMNSIFISFLVFYTILLVKMIRTTPRLDNPLTLFRLNLLRVTYFLLFFTFLVTGVIYFFILGHAGTRSALVELYLLTFSLSAFFGSLAIFFLVFVVDIDLNIIGLEKENLLKHVDHRFDNPLKFNRIMNNPSNGEIISRQKKFLLVYDKDERLVCENLRKTYSVEMAKFNQLSEEVIQKIKLPNVDILYFSAYDSNNTTSILDHLRINYQLSIEYSDSSIIHKSIQNFNSKKFKYALIVIFPSLWSIDQKMWLVRFSPLITNEIIQFMENYHEYLINLSHLDKISTMILKFEKKGDNQLPIPPISPDISMPDPKFVQFL